MQLLITKIKTLVQTEDKHRLFVSGKDMAKINMLDNAYLLIKDDKITDFGKMENFSDLNLDKVDEVFDASGKIVMPAFCDPHTHLVYAGSREVEFIDKIKGLSYEEIAKRGGGILNSAKLLHSTSEEVLAEMAFHRLEEIISLGTGAVEIKSGYGLNLEDELKMLRVIRALKEISPLTIKSTFLGAHAVPSEYKQNRGKYIELIIKEMIPKVTDENLADFIDVFCDKGFFTVEETEKILLAGIKHGLKAKIHANELGFTGGVQVGVKYNALSVDHLEHVGDEEIEALMDSITMPTLLPGTAFFLGLVEPPARKIIDAGLPVAMASDYNPGSSPSGNIQFVMSLGCIRLKMLPEEVINAVTINSAYAMEISDTLGSISRGKTANLIITKEIPSYQFMPYSFGSNLVEKMVLNGKIQ